MKIAIISVPHTGTHFINQLFGGDEWVHNGKKQKHDDVEIHTMHVYELPVYELALQEGYTIISPMRHPLLTARSWVNWYARLDDETMRHNKMIPKEQMRRQADPYLVPKLYDNMIYAGELYDVSYIPVDSERRVEYLTKLNHRLGTDITTHWGPVNTIGEHTIELPQDLAGQVAEMMNKHADFFGQFY